MEDFISLETQKAKSSQKRAHSNVARRIEDEFVRKQKIDKLEERLTKAHKHVEIQTKADIKTRTEANSKRRQERYE